MLLLPLSSHSISFSQPNTAALSISGSVCDEQGAPIPFANVFLLKTTQGGMTDASGRFLFTVQKKGKATLVVSCVGYERFTTDVTITASVDLRITLVGTTVKADEVVVTASSYASEKEKGVVMSSMDVITTPGGAADIFQSLKTLPGLTQVSESAELYVRGGDPIETVTLVDQASLYHPYTFESAFGGIFSSLNTSTISSMFFSSGGFSTKYGNVLSGVLEVETRDHAPIPRFGVGVSIANAAINAELPLGDGNTSMRLNGRHSFTRPLFWLNGGVDRFTLTPESRDLSVSLTHRYSETGRVKLHALLAADEQGVNVERPELTGVFNGTSTNTLMNLQLKDIMFANTVSRSSVSFNRYRSTWKLGVLNLFRKDEVLKLRSDAEQTLSSRLILSYGVEAEKRATSYQGTVPSEDYDLRADAPQESLDALYEGMRIGAYTEIEVLRLFGNPHLFAIAGLRTDHIPGPGLTWFDPRGSIGVKIDGQSTVRFATGLFGQLPDARLYAARDGNPRLGPMRAIHYIVSYDYNIDDGIDLRVELFHKQYHNLPLEQPQVNYDNSGRGYARGLDMVLKGKLGFVSGWISYGYLDSKRLWMDFTRQAPSPYDITHNVAVVVKVNMTQDWQCGITYKHATGRPYTQIIGAVYHPGQNIYEPVKGAPNSSRYPEYRRLDIRLTYLAQLFGEHFAVFYVEGLNILNIENIFGYNYSSDYSDRKEIRSYFGRRLLVLGMQVSF